MIPPPYPYCISNQQLWLSHERCIFWEQQQLLILSDTHFGKSGHFRKEGIAIPQNVYQSDIDRLAGVIEYFKPRGIIIIGDMFHSSFNKEIEYFKKFREDFAEVNIYLIRGNHDLLNKNIYRDLAIDVYDDTFDMSPFTFVHDLNDLDKKYENYIFSGHVHPGIDIKGKGRQRLRLPCFHFTSQHAYMPAFSRFTGMANIKKGKGDTIFMLTEDGVIKH
jgi:DNA ligase-associated metallophosphoesterase